MIFEITSRASGRTTRAVEWFRTAENRHLVVRDTVDKMRIYKDFELSVKQLDRLHTATEFNTGIRCIGRNSEIFIDCLEYFLRMKAAPFQFVGFNLSCDD